MTPVMIAFEHVSFGYDDETPLLCDVSFEIFSQEMVGVVGPNGQGKTTALKLMMGLLNPDGGTIRIRGASPKKEMNSIGYVPQSHHYDKKFPISTKEVILTGAVSKVNWLGQLPLRIKERATLLMKKLDLERYANLPFGSLSGGQAQKVLLARALIGDPPILLLDEPTANIDPQSEEAIFTFLKTLTGKKTVITVTHNFEAIVRYMDRVLCFQKTVTSLKPKEVCSHFTLGMYHPTELI